MPTEEAPESSHAHKAAEWSSSTDDDSDKMGHPAYDAGQGDSAPADPPQRSQQGSNDTQGQQNPQDENKDESGTPPPPDNHPPTGSAPLQPPPPFPTEPHPDDLRTAQLHPDALRTEMNKLLADRSLSFDTTGIHSDDLFEMAQAVLQSDHTTDQGNPEAALRSIQHKARELSSRTLLMGVMCGCRVRVHGLQAKPELNGQ